MSAEPINTWEAEVATRTLGRYVALLRRDGAWGGTDEEKFLAAGRALGKTLPEMTADRRTVALARDLRGEVEAGEGLDEPIQAAQRAVAEFDEETRRVVRERQAEHGRLWLAASELQQRMLRAQHARNRLDELVGQNPALLGEGPVAR